MTANYVVMTGSSLTQLDPVPILTKNARRMLYNKHPKLKILEVPNQKWCKHYMWLHDSSHMIIPLYHSLFGCCISYINYSHSWSHLLWPHFVWRLSCNITDSLVQTNFPEDTYFSAFFSATYIRASISGITTLPLLHSDIIFGEIGLLRIQPCQRPWEDSPSDFQVAV